ncbi:hypothetical protein TCAL_07145 [Tigriopus californicus]|uniref:PUL domain-containing protein n=1 Tax=Tigriopus californicus TaxID=6832 RepID=A0A553NE94_TIGCA|nr:hypothetical protein TCAL_07145 [Tigriopus californicus]
MSIPLSSSSSYRFSTVLEGHSGDVRCLSVIPAASFVEADFALVSGSRDHSAKLWHPDPATKNATWHCDRTLAGHQRYVTAVTVKEPDTQHPQGLIFTGSQDGHIRTYHPCSNNPIGDTEAHAANVSALFISKTGTLISGSWDTTAKVWVNEMKLTMTLTGHEIAVWAVAILPECGVMITTGADKTIKLWKGGVCKQTVTGAHSQAVRCLTIVSKEKFMSGSNDYTVKVWQVDPQAVNTTCLKTVQAHNNFIYSMSAFSEDKFIIGGENSGIKVFKDFENEQVLQVPAISVWSVAALPNGDIAGGCSDGRTWIFSADPARQASEDALKSYETALAGFHRPAQTELDGVDVKKLPGTEALHAPGRKDGQTLMVRDGPNICVYSWSAGVKQQPSGGGGAVDPFTGGGAYSTSSNSDYPSNGSNANNAFSSSSYGGGADPFTGGGMDVDVTNTFFPQTSYLAFSVKPKVEMMVKKLKEFNSQVGDELKVDEAILERLPALCSSDGSTGDVASLMKALRWPKDLAFPALDILRLAITNPSVNPVLLEDVVLNDLLSLMLANMKSEMPINCQMLAMRTLVNMFSVPKGERVMLQCRDSIITRLLTLFPSENKNIQVAMATLILNYAVAGYLNRDEECQVQCISSLTMLFLDGISDFEARFRTLVAIGTLMGDQNNAKYFLSLDGKNKLQVLIASSETPEKVSQCSKFILRSV